jgi:hypothetical protein
MGTTEKAMRRFRPRVRWDGSLCLLGVVTALVMGAVAPAGAQSPTAATMIRQSLGGQFTSGPAVARNADGRLEVFAIGTDSILWHRRQLTPGGNDWSNWEFLGGIFRPYKNIAVGSNADGRLQVFVTGTDDALWTNWQLTPAGPYSGWVSLGGIVPGDPAVGRNADGRLEAFARGSDGALWHLYQLTPNGIYSQWQSLGGAVAGNVAVGYDAGRLTAFVRRPGDNALWHLSQVAVNDSSRWSSWINDGSALARDPVADRRYDGRLSVYFIAGNLLSALLPSQPGGSLRTAWQYPAPDSGFADAQSLAVVSGSDGREDLFVRGNDRSLYHMWHIPRSASNATEVWSGWINEGGAFIGEPAVGQHLDGRLAVFLLGADSAVWAVSAPPSSAPPPSGAN